MKRIISGNVLFLLCIVTSVAQKVSIHGFVYDSSTLVTLVHAHVLSNNSGSGTLTNNEGYFTLEVDKSIPDRIQFSYVGYQAQYFIANISSDTLLHVHLSPDTLKGVEVIATKDRISNLAFEHLTTSKLATIPMLMGERDIYSALSMFAGVNFGVEGKAEINVRGGTGDQNLIIYDDIPLYSSGHLLGFISIFNPLSLKSVSFYKDQIPPRFGSRLSSVIDIVSEDGNGNKFTGSYSIGLINSQANINGPIGKNVTYSLSSRLANMGLLLLPIKVLYDAGSLESYGNFIMNDYNLKTKVRIDDYHHMTVSILRGSDKGLFQNKDAQTLDEVSSSFYWQNNLLATKYMGTLSPFWYLKATLFLSDFNNSKRLDNNLKDQIVFRYEDKSDLQEVGIRVDNEISLSNGKDLQVGLYGSRFKNRANEVSAFNSENVTKILSPGGTNRLELIAGYVNGEFRKGSSTISTGIRWNRYYNPSFSQSLLEPRLFYTRAFGTSHISLGYTRLSQPLHQANGLNSDLPVSSWVVSQDNLPVSTSSNFSMYYDGKLSKRLELACGLYWREFKNLTDFPLGTEYILDIRETIVERFEKEGIGRAYGLEFEIEHEYRKLHTIFAGTISSSRRRFTNINETEWYRTQYQRDYAFKTNAVYRFHSGRSIGLNVIWMSGAPVTYPEGFALRHPDAGSSVIPVYNKKHNAVGPAYSRIDVQYNKDYETKKGRDASLTIGIYNISGRYNPWAIEVYPKYIVSDANTVYVEGKFRKTTFFNFLPYITLGRHF